MDKALCPHCKAHELATVDVPKDVVVVAPCPACQELCVLFRGKVLPLNRKVIESGSFEERRSHLANIIAEFLDPAMFNMLEEEVRNAGVTRRQPRPKDGRSTPAESSELVPPITDEELDRFVRLDLKYLDNAAYFKRHFG